MAPIQPRETMVAMTEVTISVFDRYRIVPEQDLADGLARLAGHSTAARSRKVLRMRRR